MQQKEHEIQKAVVIYLRYQYPEALYCASAGGLFTSKRQGAKMVAAGYVKGYPDLAIYETRGGFNGLFIELKTKVGKTSPEQRNWIAKLMERGYYAQICKGSEEAINLINLYLGGKVTR